jgi:hypothetical protein
MNSHEVNRQARQLVEFELMQRGAGSVTSRGTRKVRLHANNSSQNRSVEIRVKAKRKGNWHATTDEASLLSNSGDHEAPTFWVFVDLGGPPIYWIVPDRWIRNDIHDAHRRYLDRHGGHRAKNHYSNHHSIEENRIEEWKNKWEILGIF